MKKYIIVGLITLSLFLASCSKTPEDELSNIMKQSLETRWSYGVKDENDWKLIQKSLRAELNFLKKHTGLLSTDDLKKIKNTELRSAFENYYAALVALERSAEYQTNEYLTPEQYKKSVEKYYSTMSKSIAIIHKYSPIEVEEKYKSNLDYMLTINDNSKEENTMPK